MIYIDSMETFRAYNEKFSVEKITFLGLSEILNHLSDKFGLLEINSEKQQILMTISTFDISTREEISLFLEELQDLTLLSYVALVNPSTQLMLVTIRG